MPEVTALIPYFIENLGNSKVSKFAPCTRIGPAFLSAVLAFSYSLFQIASLFCYVQLTRANCRIVA